MKDCGLPFPHAFTTRPAQMPGPSRGAIVATASADVITGTISKSTRSLHFEVHCSSKRSSSHSITWKQRRKSAVTQLLM